MMPAEFLTERLDYLQRIGIIPEAVPLTPDRRDLTDCQPDGGSLLHIHGIGQRDKHMVPQSQTPEQAEQGERLLCEDMLIGLAGQQLPLVFFAGSDGERISLSMGVWAPRRGGTGNSISPSSSWVQERHEVLASSLRSLYPAIRLKPASNTSYNVTQLMGQGIVAANMGSGGR
jgi:hypothetical protein